MDNQKLIKLIKLVVEQTLLENNDKEKEEMLLNNPFAFREGFETYSMQRVGELEEEIQELLKIS